MFASYVSRGYSKPRLIFSRINGPNVMIYWPGSLVKVEQEMGTKVLSSNGIVYELLPPINTGKT